jgi:hypothetical protein
VAISPPSDIVLDVIRAADPMRYSAAAEKLSRIGGGLDVAEEGLFGAFDAVEEAAAGAPDLRDALAAVEARSPCRAEEPFRKFEAFVLQSFVEAMLPDDAEHVFGSGNAGAIWKSFLAEEIGKEIADAGGVGIADQIARSYAGSPEGAVSLLGGGLAESRLPHPSASSGMMTAPTKVAGYLAALELDFADAVSGDAEPADAPSSHAG